MGRRESEGENSHRTNCEDHPEERTVVGRTMIARSLDMIKNSKRVNKKLTREEGKEFGKVGDKERKRKGKSQVPVGHGSKSS